MAWTAQDPALCTVIEVSYDKGTTWKTVGAVAPGTITATISRFVPDHTVDLRAYAARDDGKPKPAQLLAPRR